MYHLYKLTENEDSFTYAVFDDVTGHASTGHSIYQALADFPETDTDDAATNLHKITFHGSIEGLLSHTLPIDDISHEFITTFLNVPVLKTAHPELFI